MRKILALSISSLLLAIHFSYAGDLTPHPTKLDPEQILKKLIPEIPDIKMVTPEDLEPNPQGKYRRHAFIQGDFNRDGQEDIAICATDQWVREGISLRRNSYVLIATKRKNGTWVREFFQKFSDFSSPFLIWDRERMRLLIGVNQSDYEPGDILWDSKEKKYKLVPAAN
jgi:hypothetical protein